MLYIVALIFPPLALLMVGAWFQAVLNFVLFALSAIIFIGTLSLASPISFPIWVISVAWAILVVYRYYSDARMRAIVRETLSNDPR